MNDVAGENEHGHECVSRYPLCEDFGMEGSEYLVQHVTGIFEIVATEKDPAETNEVKSENAADQPEGICLRHFHE